MAQVDPLVEQLVLLPESLPVEAKAENIFLGSGALQTGQRLTFPRPGRPTAGSLTQKPQWSCWDMASPFANASRGGPPYYDDHG